MWRGICIVDAFIIIIIIIIIIVVVVVIIISRLVLVLIKHVYYSKVAYKRLMISDCEFSILTRRCFST